MSLQDYRLEHNTISDCVVKAEAYTSIAANPVEEKVSSFSLIIAPLKTLLVYYVLRNGWRDGTSGLIMCMMRAISTFLTLAKVWEKNDRYNDHLQP